MGKKTAELTGAALNNAVHELAYPDEPIKEGCTAPPYSTDWAFCGPIIERERITIEWEGDPDSWCACIMADQEVYGPTALIAAMRCYVASKLGDEVEIPEELK